MNALTLNLDTVNLTDDQFYELCRRNQNFRFERTQTGELIVMPPVGRESARREADFITDFGIWNRQSNLGVAATQLLESLVSDPNVEMANCPIEHSMQQPASIFTKRDRTHQSCRRDRCW